MFKGNCEPLLALPNGKLSRLYTSRRFTARTITITRARLDYVIGELRACTPRVMTWSLFQLLIELKREKSEREGEGEKSEREKLNGTTQEQFIINAHS